MYNIVMEEIKASPAENKSKKLTKKQIIGIVAIVLGAIFAVAGLVTVFVLNFSKVVPSKVTFIDNAGQIYCQAAANDNYNGYKFKFKYDEGQFEVISDSSLLRVDTLDQLKQIGLGKKYEVSVCYRGEVEGGNSDYSEPINWQYYKYLDTPSLKVDASSIVWDKIDGADYYMVYFSASSLDSIKVTQNKIDFSALPMGKRNILVIACSDQEYLKQSLKAGTLGQPVEITHTLLPFVKATLTGTTLEITARQEVNIVEVRIGDKSYFVQDFKKLETGYVYQKDISSILGNAQKVEVRPSSDNKYLLYDPSQENDGFTQVTIQES